MEPINHRKRLMATIETIDAKLQHHEERVIRVGLLGTRGAGKSSLLTSWYLFQSDRRRQVDLNPDEDTMAYLRHISETLLNTGSVPATGIAEPEVLKFGFSFKGMSRQIETIDFAGLTLLPTKEEHEKEDAAPSREYLKKCDVVICLFDCMDRSIDTANAINLIFGSTNAYFILVLTKIDQVSSFLKTKNELQELIDLLEQENDVLTELRWKIENAGRKGQWCISVLSALGADFTSEDAPKKPPLTRDDLCPFNIYQPLVRTIDFFDQSKRELQVRRKAIVDELGSLDRRAEEIRAVKHREEAERRRLKAAAFEEERNRHNQNLVLLDSKIEEFQRTVAQVDEDAEVEP